MALIHGEGIIEVACNLLGPTNVGDERVLKEVEHLAREEGVSVEKGYCIDFSQQGIVNLLSHALRRFNPSGEFSFQCQIGLSFKGKLGD